MVPTAHTNEELDFDVVVGNKAVTPIFDPHWINYIPEGFDPVVIVSGGKLVENSDGLAEGLKNIGMEVIEDEASRCVWEELIIEKKVLKTYIYRGCFG